MSRLFFSQTPHPRSTPLPPAVELPGAHRLLRGEAGLRQRAVPVAWDEQPDSVAPSMVGEDASGGATQSWLENAAVAPAGMVPGALPPPGSPGVEGNSAAAQQEAEALRAAARQEAEALRAAARQEAEALRAAAQQEAEALQAAAQQEADALRAAARGEVEQARMAAAKVRGEARALLAEAAAVRAGAGEAAEAARQAALAAAADDMVGLALAVARRVLRQELALRPEAVAAMVMEALARVEGDPAIQLTCAPTDLPLLQAAAGINPEPRAGLSPGDFLVHSGEGEIDGRLESQLAALASALEAAATGEAER